MQAPIVEARMKNPAMVVPDALQPLLDLAKATKKIGVPPRTADLVHLRVAQINGCSYCVDMHARPQEGGRDGRAPLRVGGLAGGALLHRSRTRRTGSRRGRHTPE